MTVVNYVKPCCKVKEQKASFNISSTTTFDNFGLWLERGPDTHSCY